MLSDLTKEGKAPNLGIGQLSRYVSKAKKEDTEGHLMSYSLLPSLADKMRKADPTSTIVLKTKPVSYNYPGRQEGDREFVSLLIQPSSSMHFMRNQKSNIMSTDGAHLKGPLRGTMLATHAKNANNNNFPLSVMICGSENTNNYNGLIDSSIFSNPYLELIISDKSRALNSVKDRVAQADRDANDKMYSQVDTNNMSNKESALDR